MQAYTRWGQHGLQTAVIPPASNSEECALGDNSHPQFQGRRMPGEDEDRTPAPPKGLWQQPKQIEQAPWECYNKQIRTFQLQAQAATWSNLQIVWTPIVKPGAILGACVVWHQLAKLGLAGKRWMCCGDHHPQESTDPSFQAPRQQICLHFAFILCNVFFIVRKDRRKELANTSCLLGENTDRLPCQTPHAKPSAVWWKHCLTELRRLTGSKLLVSAQCR